MVCPESWVQFQGHCYYLVEDKYDMRECRAICRQKGGEGADLASIHSQAENQFLASMIEHRPVRFGEKVRGGECGASQWGQAREILAISRIPGLQGR